MDTIHFYSRYLEFEFNNKDLFEIVVNMLINLYNLNFYKKDKERYYQTEFRKNIIERDKLCFV